MCVQVQTNATYFTLQQQPVDISVKCVHKAGLSDLPSGSSIAKQIIGIILSISEYLQEELKVSAASYLSVLWFHPLTAQNDARSTPIELIRR